MQSPPSDPDRVSAPITVCAIRIICVLGMSAFYGPTPGEQEALRVIHRALELGVTLLDTSDMYGPFTNEELVGALD